LNRRSGGENSFAFGKDVDSGIEVPIVGSAALRALPLPDIQVFNNFVPEATAVADLRRREPSSDTDDGSSIPISLVRQHVQEHSPSSVVLGLGKVAFGDLPYIQVLDCNRLVLANESG
jgi:hypothetical protein